MCLNWKFCFVCVLVRDGLSFVLVSIMSDFGFSVVLKFLVVVGFGMLNKWLYKCILVVIDLLVDI